MSYVQHTVRPSVLQRSTGFTAAHELEAGEFTHELPDEHLNPSDDSAEWPESLHAEIAHAFPEPVQQPKRDCAVCHTKSCFGGFRKQFDGAYLCRRCDLRIRWSLRHQTWYILKRRAMKRMKAQVA